MTLPTSIAENLIYDGLRCALETGCTSHRSNTGMVFSSLLPECYNCNIVPASPYTRRNAMPMTTPSFRDDADAEQHLTRHLRRMLLVGYYQDTVSEHTITDEHIADTFAH